MPPTSNAPAPARAEEPLEPRALALTPERLAHLHGYIARAGGARAETAVEAPFTGQVFGHVPACTADDVAEAVARARAAQAVWAERPADARARLALRLHEVVLDRRDEILDLMQLEAGKGRLHAAEEVLDVANVARYYGVRAAEWLAPASRKGALPGLTDTDVRHVPVGVVGIIAPWNYPFMLPVTDAVPALLAGNAVVLKPAEATPFTALLGAELLREAGFPENVFQVVTGEGRVLGPPLIGAVDYVCFTGSTAVGRQVARQAGERLIGCSMELGGKNAALVLEDAPEQRTVEGVLRACFGNEGQMCVSAERVYIHRHRYADLRDALAEATRRITIGPAYDYSTTLGSLLGPEQLAKVEAHVEDARAKGATVLCGGRARPDLGPYFYEPTLLEGVTPEMALYREETFGPVAALYAFTDEDEAVALANDSEYGLNASVWTADADRGRAVAARLRCGTVNVNEGYAAAWGSADAPMGGMKASGLGRRHGPEGFFKYTEALTIAVQRGMPIAPPFGAPPELYARALAKAVGLMRHIPGLR